MSVTTKDIAKICGVSRGTVDRALNGKPQIKAATREHIIQVAKELGYKPDLLARSLVKGKSMSIGVVVFDVRNRYFAQMLNTIAIEAKKYGYFVYITLTEKDPKTEIDAINRMIERRVDGIIISPINEEKYFRETFADRQLPIVSVTNRISDEWNFVGIDDRKAVYDGLDYILSNHYQRVVFYCPPLSKRNTENIYAQDQRAKSFQEYFETRSDIEHMIISKRDYGAVMDLFKSDKRTVIFCSSDTFALDLLDTLKTAGKRIPEDIGLMGFDNIDFLKYVSPQLSTINNNVEEQALKAVDCLISMINGEQPEKAQYIPHTLVKGNSI